MALFDWTDRYLPVTVPDYSQIGSPAFYYLIAIQQFDWFALSAMMFVSGFFISFAVGGKDRKADWKITWMRIKNLMIPFFIWTLIFFIVFIRDLPNEARDVLDRYYYIPLLCVFYIISPILVPFAKKHWKALLITAAILELGRFGLRYSRDLGVVFPGQAFLIQITPRWLPPNLFFWFAMGMVVGFYRNNFTTWLAKVKWFALGGMIVFGALTLVEYRAVANYLGEPWLGSYFGGLSRYFYALAFILFFLAFDTVKIPYSKSISDVGSKSLGIYLVHSRWMYVAAVLLYRLAPRTLGNQLIYQLALISIAIGGSLLLMALVRRSPAKKYYRYVFG